MAPQVAPANTPATTGGKRTSLSEKERVKAIQHNAKDAHKASVPLNKVGGLKKGGVNGSPSSTPIVPSRTVTASPLRSPSTYFRQDAEKKKKLDYLDDLLDSFNIQGILGVLLILSLFLTDMCIIFNLHEDNQVYIDSIMLIIFIAFILECTALVIAKEKYFLGFFFWMDVLGTLSMILDISWFSDELGLGAAGGDANLLRAARSAKVGAKSGRLAKLTKLFKLVEQCWTREHTLLKKDESAIPPAKQIARALSGVLSRRVAALVLTLILVTPLLMHSTIDYSFDAHVDTFDALIGRIDAGGFGTEDWNLMANEFEDFYKGKDTRPLDLTISKEELKTDDNGQLLNVSSLDKDSLYQYTFDLVEYVRGDSKVTVTSAKSHVHSTFSLKAQLQSESLSSVLTILLVMVVLIGFTASFQNAVDELIVMPMERMMDTLKSSANSILRSVQAIAHEKGHGGMEDEDGGFDTDNIDGEVAEILETNILESMIEKLAKITSLILPGAENHYVNEANMDESTKDWIANEYLNAETKEARRAGFGTTQPLGGLAGQTSRQTRITANSPMQGKRGGADGTIRATQFRKSKTAAKKLEEKKAKLKRFEGDDPQAGDAIRGGKPDEAMRRIEQLEREMNTWTFDVEVLKVDETLVVLSMIFDTFEVSEECGITQSTLTGFFSELQRRYINENTYHNWHHAVDVTHTVFRFVVETQAHTFLMPLETFSLLVSAIAHDVGHPGFSNPYLVKTKHELAILHNDQSPLENMHCATLYEVVGDSKFDVFSGLAPDQWRAVRKIVISAILGTDMIHHFPLISKMQVFYEMYGKELQNQIANGECNVETAPGMKEAANRSFMIDVFLHAADISNPVKSFDICKKWALLVVEEFFSQGDVEKRLGLDVSPMSDRLTTNVNSMQVGFIEFVVFPLYDAFVKTFPTLEVLLRNIVNNDREWTNRRVAEIKGQNDEIKKITDRFESLKSKAEKTIDEVTPMFMKIEQQKQSWDDMIRIVSSASHIFSSDDDEAPASSNDERSTARKLLKSKLSLIDDGDEEEEDDDMRRSVKPDREQNRRNMSGSSRKVNVAAGDLEEGGGGTAPE